MSSKTARIVQAVVVAAIIAAVAIDIAFSDDPSDRVFPLPVSEEDKTYLPADEAEKEYDTAIDGMLKDLKASDDTNSMVSIIMEGYDALVTVRDQYVWAELDYSINPAKYAESYQEWSVLNSTAYDTFESALREALVSDESDMMVDALKAVGLDPDEIRSNSSMTPEEEALLKDVARLVTEYDEIMSRDYSVVADGVTVSLSDYYVAGDFTPQQRLEIYYGLLYDRWYDAAEVYADLVDVRNEYAAIQGYGNYAEYAYKELYGRDYGTEDAWNFTECTGEAFELYSQISRMIELNPSLNASNLDWIETLGDDEILDLAKAHESSIGGDLPDLMDYMRDYGLIYICNEDDSRNSAYTTSLLRQGSAIMFFGSGYTGQSLATTVIHEFGHASHLCLNTDISGCYDVLEIHSQGNEALFYATADRHLKNGSEAMAANGIRDLVYSVWSTGLWTQLELWAYETQAETKESLTVQMLSDEFDAILERNGMKGVFSYPDELNGLIWVQIPHLFHSPLYYVSYATSALNALEIYAMAVDDFDEARDTYLDLLYLHDADGYMDAVERTGLTNSLGKGEAERIIDDAFESLRKQIQR